MAGAVTTFAVLSKDAPSSAQSKRKRRRKAAFKEVFENEPKIVGKTRRKQGEMAANRQKIAIALSKARLRKSPFK